MPDGVNQSFLCVEVPEDLPQACMPDSVRRLLSGRDRTGVVGAS